MSTVVSGLRAAQNIVTAATAAGSTVIAVEVDVDIRVHLGVREGGRPPIGDLFADVLNLPVTGGTDFGNFTTTEVRWRTWTVVVFGYTPAQLTNPVEIAAGA